MSVTPVAAGDAFVVSQGQFSTTFTGHLGADNGSGVDFDPDGTVLGWTALGFNPAGDGDRYLGAFFSNGILSFLHIVGTVSYPHPAVFTSTVFATAQGGRVVLETNGQFSYTSPLGFVGVDWFDYTLVDAEFGTDIGRVTFTVAATPGANLRPIAQNDSFAAFEDAPLTGNLFADNGNGPDSDPNGDALTALNRTYMTVNGGIVSVYLNGDFTYRAATNYSGVDSFSYTVSDVHGASATGMVSLTVAAVNDLPVARADAFTASHDRPITGNVLSNNGNGADSDQEGPVTVRAQTITTAKGGHLTLGADGSFVYMPAARFVGADSFIYTIDDGQGGSASAAVTLNIVNNAPVARLDWFTVAFGKTATGNLLLNNTQGADSDADGDAITAIAAVVATLRGGKATIKADGTFTYVPPEAYYGTDSFTYAIRDAFGGTSSAQILVATAPPAGAIYGTAGIDNIAGTSGNDFIFALADDDTVSGGLGADLLAGGIDKDTLRGDTGNDKLYGQEGKDLLEGGDANDLLYGGAEADDLFGGAGSDKLTGGAGIDTYNGGLGADKFVFDAATGTSFDRVEDFTTGDKLCVVGSQYQLAKGALADASYFAPAGAADVSHGRFVYTGATRSLAWDADGRIATANIQIAIFEDSVTLAYTSFLVL